MVKLIGISPCRTGTTSLARSFMLLGYRSTLHTSSLAKSAYLARAVQKTFKSDQMPVALMSRFDALVDLPVSLFPKLTFNSWPTAKFVYLDREPDEWYESSRAVIPPLIERAKETAQPGQEFVIRFLEDVFLNSSAPIPLLNRNASIKWMRQQKSEVCTTIPADRLLISKIEMGWGPICDFLDCAHPDIEFPVSNQREIVRTWCATN